MLIVCICISDALQKAGAFDTYRISSDEKFGDKMNVIVIMIPTSVIAAFAILTGKLYTGYLITFLILVPTLYKKYGF